MGDSIPYLIMVVFLQLFIASIPVSPMDEGEQDEYHDHG